MVDIEQLCGAVTPWPSRDGGCVGATRVFAGGLREGTRERRHGLTGCCLLFARHEHMFCSEVES